MQKNVPPRISEKREQASDPVTQNVLRRVEGLLSKLTRPCLRRDPLAVLVSTSLGGVVQTINHADPGYEVRYPDGSTDEVTKIREIFADTGLVCEVRQRTRLPRKSPKGTSPSPSSSEDTRPEIFYLLYPA